MIDLANKTITLREGKSKKIVKFDVWWVTPFGIVADLEYAVAICKGHEIEPHGNLIAVPVAVAEDDSYEVVNNRIA